MTISLQQAEFDVALLFAEHLRRRTGAATNDLIDGLMFVKDARRAEHLRAFITDGAHTRPVPWWADDATCHVGLQLPAEPKPGDLWFDPLETNWSLVIPSIAQSSEAPRNVSPIVSWIATDRVTSWQLLGAHHIAPDVPESLAEVTAMSAWRYCTLFGKQLADWVTWTQLGRAYGTEVVLRLWGDSPGEIGLGGTEEDSALMLREADIRRVQDEDVPNPEQTGDRNRVGLAFRTDIDMQVGLSHDDEALERVWNT